MSRVALSPALAQWLRRTGSRRFVLAASQYTPVLGTAWVAGAATGLAADGIELPTNREFTADTANWTVPAHTTASRVDSAIDPGVASGGTDNWCLKVVSTNQNAWAEQGLALIVGATYTYAARAYSPSANTRVNNARLTIAGNSLAVAGEDAWQALSGAFVYGASAIAYLFALYTAEGDTSYFDAVSCQQQRSIATAEAGPNHRLTQVVTMPGAGVVPFGNRSRYLNASNNWYWRVTPGTAGPDFELVEVNAGIPATRVSADIDWAAATSYTVIMEARGNVYRAWVNGVLKLSYTDATNFLISEPTIAISDGKIGNVVNEPTLVEVFP